MQTLHELAADLAAGRTTSVALTEQAIERIEDPAGLFHRRDDGASVERGNVELPGHFRMLYCLDCGNLVRLARV